MKSIHKLALTVIAVLAVSAFVAAPAFADTGSGSATVNAEGGTPCTGTFDWDTGSGGGTPPAAGQDITLSNLQTDSSCDVDVLDGGGVLSLSAGNSATLEGEVVVNNPIFSDCDFEGTLNGTWDDITGSMTLVSGGFGCPSTVDDVEISDVSWS